MERKKKQGKHEWKLRKRKKEIKKRDWKCHTNKKNSRKSLNQDKKTAENNKIEWKSSGPKIKEKIIKVKNINEKREKLPQTSKQITKSRPKKKKQCKIIIYNGNRVGKKKRKKNSKNKKKLEKRKVATEIQKKIQKTNKENPAKQ